jgi:hypothetical protein
MYAIILEDSDSKIVSILTKYDLTKHHITICRNVRAARIFLSSSPSTPIDLFVDYELDPGCGNGLEFLEYALLTWKHSIGDLVITSLGIEKAREMRQLCEKHGKIPKLSQ